MSEEVIPLMEETASVGKRPIITGRLRVQTVTDTVEEIAHADVRRATVEITHVPVNEIVETAPEIRTEGDVTIVPVLEEVLVIEKRLVLKEELHIRRHVATETVEAPVTLRKQRVVVERLNTDGPPTQGELTMSSGAATGRLVTAFFDSRSDAEQAISRLHSAGISRDSIRLMPGNERDSDRSGSADPQSFPEASVGLWDSLRDLFLPDEDRFTYAEGLRRGGFLVSVDARDADYERVIDILDDEGTIDIDERSDTWRSEGWAGRSNAMPGKTANLASGPSAMSGNAANPGFGGSGMTNTTSQRTTGGDEVIPIAEEELHVGKRDVSHGRVRVRSYVVERPVSEQVSLREEHVEVERRPVSGSAQSGAVASDPFQERMIEVEERSEEAVVSKEARLVEEVVVRKEAEQRTETISDTVRRTEVDVEDERRTDADRTGTTNRKP
ncbi:YsnF/AvaK domain-containing protein [Microvirga rosea]|uniref:YsnF/AvaK domain-containing protein n=1 Tax=Microvirga rosea TaxID=2715425 RepID=UPI001D0AD818|nr:YsnF/AvaK domain-containing protein [Microvirga rosea]MCB8821451.1 YsnF/AvaK domain-containing protein [Microvirga rosea]